MKLLITMPCNHCGAQQTVEAVSGKHGELDNFVAMMSGGATKTYEGMFECFNCHHILAVTATITDTGGTNGQG